LNAVESSPVNGYNITDQTGTQIQIKLGQNIDVVMASQFLTNSLDYLNHDKSLKERVKKATERLCQQDPACTRQEWKHGGSGWAGVLQSSFASNALESAQSHGASVDNEALERAREFQKNNYDSKTGNVNTDMGGQE